MRDKIENMVWLSVAQVSTYLGCSPSFIYKAVSKKRVPFSRAVGRLRFNREDIDRWMHEGDYMDSTKDKSVAGP